MPTERKRLTFIPDAEALAVLGYSADDGHTVCSVGPARRLARLVEQAAAELTLTRADWNAIAEAMEGCPTGFDVPPIDLIRIRLDNAGNAKLKAKLKPATSLHGEAIMAAVRWVRMHPAAAKGEWWEPGYRKGKVRNDL